MTERKEYIITENTENYGWCLFRLVAGNTEKEARKALVKAKQDYPHKELRLEQVQKEDCWWNDPTMVR